MGGGARVAGVNLTAAVVIVGTGPAGTSAAWPLVRAGLDVLLVEAGGPIDSPPPNRPTLADVRGDRAGWSHLLGSQMEALRASSGSSPKIRTSFPPGALDGYLQANRISAEGFTAVGLMARGGLSNVWGAGASAFDPLELSGWPITLDDLMPSYQDVCRRVGISGSQTDDLSGTHGHGLDLDPELTLGPLMETLLERYGRRRSSLRIRVGRARQAVLTRSRGTRGACALDNFCMWRCAKGSIYNAADEVAVLSQAPNVRLLEYTLVEAVEAGASGWRVRAQDRRHGGSVEIAAGRVVLAAGVLPSTRLVLAALDRYDAPVRLHSTPSFTSVFLDPSYLGRALPQRGFGLGQLTVTTTLDSDHSALGTLFLCDSVSAADLAVAMPFSRRGAIRIARDLASGLLVGLFYLPSSYSNNTTTLTRTRDGAGALHVSGGLRPDALAVMRSTIRSLSSDFRKLGFARLPGSFKVHAAGSESHYGGTLPMGVATSTTGEVVGAPGLFVADGAVLPALPAKHHTFTVMANADRIGHHLVASA